MYKRDNFITLNELTHTYTDTYGTKYVSMSKIIESVTVPFDAQTISARMSGGDQVKQKALLKQWADKRDFAANYGTKIHNALEDYFNAKTVNDIQLLALAKRLSVELKGYYNIYPEAILHLFDKKLAGTTDLLAQRQKTGNVFDFYDYKTNIDRGIYYDSISRKKDKEVHYNKFLLEPLNHLEDCNYNRYALQLSGYAYMTELTYGVTPGKLFIIYIFKTITGAYDFRLIPIPYMKFEVARLFQHFITLKKL